jgi:hypothetical protein
LKKGSIRGAEKILPAVDPAKLIPTAFVQPQSLQIFRPSRYMSVVWAVLLSFAFLYSAVLAQASSDGISGFSGKSGSTCTSCHSGSTTKGTKVLNGEIAHSAPSITRSWTFNWTAPTVTANTNVTLYAASIDSYGGGTGTIQRAITVTPPATAPTIGVSPASLTFNYQSGGATPAAQALAVSSSGTAFNYTISTSVAWLSATPATGSTQET